MHGVGAEEQEQEAERDALAVHQRHRLELTLRAVQLGDLAVIAHGDAVAVEIADQVVGHRLAQVGASVHQRHQCAAARQPDRRLRRRVAAADDADARAAAGCASGGPAA